MEFFDFKTQILTTLIIFLLLKSTISSNLHGSLVQSECSYNKLVVKGFDIHISDILNINCFETSQFIEIFALNKLFIDADIYRIGHKIQLTAIAPTIETVGLHMIDLSGTSGERHSTQKALPSVGDGRHGKPGKPGGSSGSILAIANQFPNQLSLFIHASGGDGGAGQDGGDGMEQKHFFGLQKTECDDKRRKTSAFSQFVLFLSLGSGLDYRNY